MFRPGDPKAVCDRCGSTYHLSDLKPEWNNLRVCAGCWEPRHPQEFVRARVDKQTVPNARPEPPPIYLTTDGVYEDGVYAFGTYGSWTRVTL